MANWMEDDGSLAAERIAARASMLEKAAQRQAEREKLPEGIKHSRVDYSGAGTPGQYTGQAFVLEGYEQLIGGRVFLRNDEWTFFDTDHAHLAKVDSNECASLVQAFGVPHTSYWRRGPRVKDAGVIKPGTVIATMGDGVYYTDYSGRSHVGIYLGKTDEGITVIDQWNGANVGRRLKRYDVEPTLSDYVKDGKKQPDQLWNVPIRDAAGRLLGYGPLPTQDSKGKKFNNTADGDAYFILLADQNVAYKAMTKEQVVAAGTDKGCARVPGKPLQRFPEPAWSKHLPRKGI
jgi:hypothetical protein